MSIVKSKIRIPKRKIALLAVTLTSVLALFASAADWTEFRGPTGQGHAAVTGLPVTWSKTENIAWRQEIPGKAWSSPIILGRQIFLTNAVPIPDSKEQSLRALCLDVATGKTLWDEQIVQQATPKIHQKNSHASPTPVTDGKRLWVHFGPYGTACLDLAGKILWTNTDLKYAPVHGTGGSPVLIDDLLVLSCDGSDNQFVVALEQNTGRIRWKSDRRMEPSKGFSFGTPLVIDVNGRKQIVSSGTDVVTAYDPKDGSEIWKVRYDGYSVVPRPVFGHGMVFICTGYNQPQVLAIRTDGTGDVTDTHVRWSMKKGAPHNPSPLLVGDELYLVSDAGVATCLDAISGDQHWQQRLGGNYSASPLFADGKIYFLSEDGEGIVIKAGTTFEELSRNPLGERALASFAVADGALFIRTEGHLARVQSR